jgi:hypothetical protein
MLAARQLTDQHPITASRKGKYRSAMSCSFEGSGATGAVAVEESCGADSFVSAAAPTGTDGGMAGICGRKPEYNGPLYETDGGAVGRCKRTAGVLRGKTQNRKEPETSSDPRNAGCRASEAPQFNYIQLFWIIGPTTLAVRAGSIKGIRNPLNFAAVVEFRDLLHGPR